jgi:hypothetical protein
MLRMGFLPSDYNPMLLMLGEAEDLRLLAAVLRRFAREPCDVCMNQLGFCAVSRAQVTLTASPGAPGIHPLPQTRIFRWRLNAERADAFADQIDALAQPARVAGSEVLACTTGEEIPVKVSRGEYTDDFLLGTAA